VLAPNSDGDFHFIHAILKVIDTSGVFYRMGCATYTPKLSLGVCGKERGCVSQNTPLYGGAGATVMPDGLPARNFLRPSSPRPSREAGPGYAVAAIGTMLAATTPAGPILQDAATVCR
jgi:hypothetical protein